MIPPPHQDGLMPSKSVLQGLRGLGTSDDTLGEHHDADFGPGSTGNYHGALANQDGAVPRSHEDAELLSGLDSDAAEHGGSSHGQQNNRSGGGSGRNGNHFAIQSRGQSSGGRAEISMGALGAQNSSQYGSQEDSSEPEHGLLGTSATALHRMPQGGKNPNWEVSRTRGKSRRQEFDGLDSIQHSKSGRVTRKGMPHPNPEVVANSLGNGPGGIYGNNRNRYAPPPSVLKPAGSFAGHVAGGSRSGGGGLRSFPSRGRGTS